MTGGGADRVLATVTPSLEGAAAAHREVEQGHTRGKLVLIVDDDLAAELEI